LPARTEKNHEKLSEAKPVALKMCVHETRLIVQNIFFFQFMQNVKCTVSKRFVRILEMCEGGFKLHKNNAVHVYLRWKVVFTIPVVVFN
jgi:hypothetical protein